MIMVCQCPSCHKHLSVEVALGNVSITGMTPAQPVSITGLKKITDDDRKAIVQSYLTAKSANTWTMEKKKNLSLTLGLSIGQIAAVTAWCHTNLGGSRYSKKYN
jgi:hypothetical protein